MNIIDIPDIKRRLPRVICLRCIFAKQEEATYEGAAKEEHKFLK